MTTTKSASDIRPIVRLCETGIMLALAIVLSIFPLYELPYGGSITLASMLPMLIIAYRHGMKWGFFSAAVYGLLQALLGASNFGYVPGIAAFVCILLFDYFVAFAMIGLGGAFRKLKDPALALALGALVACVLRYICHVISGCTVWASTPFVTDGAAISYSIMYNLSYMLPETIVTVGAAWWIGKQLDFRKPELGRAVREKAVGSVPAAVCTIVGSLVIAGAVTYDLVELVIALMTTLSAAGFDSASFALSAVVLPWERMLIVSAICAVVGAVLLVIAHLIRQQKKNGEKE